MLASFWAETLKARKRWANWILFGIFIVLVLLFGYVITYLVLKNPPRRFESPIPAAVLIRETYPENLLANVLNSMTSIGAAIMIILGGLSTASEYGWVTVQTILVQKPGRGAVLGGKQLNLGIIVVIFAVVILAAAALTSTLIAGAAGASSSLPSNADLLKGFGALVLELAVWTGFGMFLGVAFRSTAAAIGGGLVYLFVVEAVLARLLADNDVVKEILKFLPGVATGALNAAFPLSFHNPAAQAPLISIQRGTITLIVYLVAFTVLALVIFERRDVTGG